MNKGKLIFVGQLTTIKLSTKINHNLRKLAKPYYSEETLKS